MKIKLGNIIKGLVRETLQTLPIVGTIVTNIKTNTTDNPKGQLNLKNWDIYRLIFGSIIAYLVVKGVDPEKVIFITSTIGF